MNVVKEQSLVFFFLYSLTVSHPSSRMEQPYQKNPNAVYWNMFTVAHEGDAVSSSDSGEGLSAVWGLTDHTVLLCSPACKWQILLHIITVRADVLFLRPDFIKMFILIIYIPNGQRYVDLTTYFSVCLVLFLGCLYCLFYIGPSVIMKGNLRATAYNYILEPVVRWNLAIRRFCKTLDYV